MEETTQYVTLSLDDQEYGVGISMVNEIIRAVKPTCVPLASPWMLGVINLRGHLIPVIDLRLRMGMQPCESTSRTRIVVLQINDRRVGLRVDSVAEVVRVSDSEVRTPPDIMEGTEEVLGVALLEERLVTILNASVFVGIKEEEAAV